MYPAAIRKRNKEVRVYFSSVVDDEYCLTTEEALSLWRDLGAALFHDTESHKKAVEDFKAASDNLPEDFKNMEKSEAPAGFQFLESDDVHAGIMGLLEFIADKKGVMVKVITPGWVYKIGDYAKITEMRLTSTSRSK